MTTGAEFIVFRLLPHEDLKGRIAEILRAHKISAGTVVSCVGSLEQIHLRFANQPHGAKISGHFEILALTGTVSLEGLHLHLTVGDEKGQVTGGHLLDDNLIYTTAEVTIAVFADLIFKREVDATYGYRELSIQKKPGR